MKANLALILCLLLGAVAPLRATDQVPRDLRGAESAFVEFDYFEALDGFLRGNAKHPDNAFVKRRIADCYRLMGLTTDALEWYKQLIEAGGYDALDFYYMSEVHRVLGEHESAHFWMQQYERRVAGDTRARRTLENPDYHIDLTQGERAHLADGLGVNQGRAMLPPTVSKDLLIVPIATEIEGPWYAHRRNLVKYDLYQTTVDDMYNLVSAEPLLGQVNGKFSEGPSCYDSKREVLYVTRFLTRRGKPALDENGEVYSLILSYQLVEGHWIEFDGFPYNDDFSSQAYPALSTDGNTLYFASSREGGFGGMDLYACSWDEEANEWGYPQNMGATVNTEGSEIYPAFSPDGKLAFASNGHAGLGGLDIYFVEFPPAGGMVVTNPGMPINTPEDDFGLMFIGDRYGYFCSDREAEIGGDDLFWWESMREVIDATIVLMDPKGQPMYPERVEIRNLRSDELSKKSGLRGQFDVSFNGKDPYEIAWEHEGQLMMMLCVPELTEAGLRYQYSSPTGDGFLADAKLNSYKESAFRKKKMAQEQWTSRNLTDHLNYPTEENTDGLRYLVADWTSRWGDGDHPAEGSKVYLKNLETGAVSACTTTGLRAEFEADPRHMHAMMWYDANNQRIVKYLKTDPFDGTALAFTSSEAAFDLQMGDAPLFASNQTAERMVLAALTASVDDGVLLETIAAPLLKYVESGRRVSQENGQTRIHAEDVYFGFDEHRLNKAELQKLDEVGAVIQRTDDVRIEIVAHTDARGSKKYNDRLSRMRADATRSMLILSGIPADRIDVVWRGEEALVNDCADDVPCDPREHRMNRRAEVYIVMPS